MSDLGYIVVSEGGHGQIMVQEALNGRPCLMLCCQNSTVFPTMKKATEAILQTNKIEREGKYDWTRMRGTLCAIKLKAPISVRTARTGSAKKTKPAPAARTSSSRPVRQAA